MNPFVLNLALLIVAFIAFSLTLAVIKGFLPVWMHILTAFLGQFLGAAAGLSVYYSLHVPDKIAPCIAALPQGMQKFAWIGSFLITTTLFMMIPLRMISRFIPVRCRKQGCGGNAYLTGIHPFAYKCRLCGEIYETKVSQVGRR